MKRILIAALCAVASPAMAEVNPAFPSYDTVPAGTLIGNPNAWADNPVPWPVQTFGIVGPIAVARAVNMNSGVPADTAFQPVVATPASYLITEVRVRNCSASASTAVGAVYTAVSAGGTQITTSAALANTSATADTALTLNTGIGTTDQTATTWYWHLTTAQGSAATCDLWLYGKAFD